MSIELIIALILSVFAFVLYVLCDFNMKLAIVIEIMLVGIGYSIYEFYCDPYWQFVLFILYLPIWYWYINYLGKKDIGLPIFGMDDEACKESLKNWDPEAVLVTIVVVSVYIILYNAF